MTNKKPLIIIEGPTAVGKSDVAVLVAKKINSEIISADSVQVYRGMDIGSGKITQDEMQGIKHHLIDICDPSEDYDITRFVKKARESINEISDKGMIPIIAGGTGFYLQALLQDIDFSKGNPESEYRDELTKLANERGNEYIHELLKDIDPESYKILHPNNVKRVIRALEYYKTTGTKISEKNEHDKEKESPYDSMVFFIDMDREALYRRIELRVDKMLEAGLVDEVKSLKAKGLDKSYVSMMALGYKEILDYLDGNCDFDTAIDTLKKSTRHFAKRQLTWFNHHDYLRHIMREDFADNYEIAECICSEIKKYTNVIK